ncbi:MAG: two-component sensor histidine kinase, partial [Xanthomonadales bacterium]|nr:two-component sensor histidine kinase [Xanthomonadales bacterium]
VALAVLLLTVSLGMVGFGLDADFQKSSEASLPARMESLVYLVLAATDVNDSGGLSLDADVGDPRLQQPGSGIYAQVHSDLSNWSSPSSVSVVLPESLQVAAGTSMFSAPLTNSVFYSYLYAVRFELSDGRLLPVTVSIFVNRLELLSEQQAFRTGLWRSLGGTGVILVLAQLLLLSLGLRPLRRITRDISAIESGRMERLEDHYPKELEPLKRNLNRLLDTEKSNQTRYRNALDSLAHSLKTPLSVIRSSLPGQSSADSPADFLTKSVAIDNAVIDMQHLITTRLQRAAVSTRRSIAQAVEVKSQVARLLQSLERVYSQKMINTDVMIDPGLEFFGEQRDLLEVAGNLLDNACKYGDGRIRVSARSIDADDARAGIILQVEDNGPGIAASKRDKLIQRGVRGDERVEGHGLGLAIVLGVVTAYNGEITIDDSDLGGARLSVSLKTG